VGAATNEPSGAYVSSLSSRAERFTSLRHRHRRELEATAVVVQEPREDRGSVERRIAEVVDGAVQIDQGGGVHVADEPVVFDRHGGHGIRAFACGRVPPSASKCVRMGRGYRRRGVSTMASPTRGGGVRDGVWARARSLACPSPGRVLLRETTAMHDFAPETLVGCSGAKSCARSASALGASDDRSWGRAGERPPPTYLR
jgi:hypothetical protein